MMAFNNYYPATYQNPYFQPQQYQQATPPAQSNPAIIWVSGDNDVENFLLAPNSAVTLWHRTEPIVYLKKSDASGRTSTTVYDLVERKETAAETPVALDVDLSMYATKRDLSALSGAIEAVRQKLEEMSGDLYGIAGKRKAKKEAEG